MAERQAGYKNILGFSYMRAIACIAIIALHITASDAIIYYSTDTGATGNIVLSVIQNCLMWAVPCFVMVTGALLLPEDKKITYKKLFKKYIARILGALILFCFVFRLFSMVMDGETFSFSIIVETLNQIITDGSWSHMWYLYLLIGLYLLMPFYKKIAAASQRIDIIYLLIIYALFLAVFPLLRVWNINLGFYIHVLTIYPFYLFLGYAIYKRILKISPKAGMGFIIVTTGTLILLTVINSNLTEISLSSFWGYASIIVVLQAAGIFALICKDKNTQKGIVKKILIKVDKCSFGIYLVHMIYVRLFLRYMGIDPYIYGGIIGIILFTIMILAISYITVWILKKIPIIKNVL